MIVYSKYNEGYPVYYVNKLNECLCNECAEENNRRYFEYKDIYIIQKETQY
jgi:hypothetical protein